MPPRADKVEGDVAGFDFHGGRIDAARRAFPDAPADWIDLSTGLNPRPWPIPADLRVDHAALPSLHALAALEQAAAEAFGTTADRVAALPGVEVGLRLIATIDPPRLWHRLAPAYGSYAAALPGSTAIAANVLLDAADRGGTLLIGNPNNPDGVVHPPELLAGLAQRISARGGWLIVDEAFADCDPAVGLLPHLREDDPVIVFRSFGKFYGLGGVRLGFACGHPALLARLRDRIGSWPVSATALMVGTAAYRDQRWAAATRADLRDRAAELDAVLARHGMITRGGCPLFRLVTGIDAAATFDRLAHAGILTRPFADRPDWLRFGLPGDRAAFDRLDRALAGG